jgi:hypothetical protein
MKDSVPRQGTVAGDAPIAHRASPRHLRLVPPPSPALCSDEQAYELLAPDINHDGDRDGPTLLAW